MDAVRVNLLAVHAKSLQGAAVLCHASLARSLLEKKVTSSSRARARFLPPCHRLAEATRHWRLFDVLLFRIARRAPVLLLHESGLPAEYDNGKKHCPGDRVALYARRILGCHYLSAGEASC